MKVAYFDCFSGISGDMIIGALLDAGIDFDKFREEIYKLDLTGYELKAEKIIKSGISGTKFDVAVLEQTNHRNLYDVLKIINNNNLDNETKEKCTNIFTRIAEAEAKIHGKPIKEIHFHEVGATDSIIDIVGSIIALKLLGVKKIYSSKIRLGTGFVKSMHGAIPVPAPATAELLRGIPVSSSSISSELTTPTGAAIISSLSEDFGSFPDMEFESIGYGAGSRDLEIPNLLRVFIGKISQSEYQTDNVTMIETNIDDMNPEFYEYISGMLLTNGALDVFSIPVMMKKSRPGTLLSILTEEKNLKNLLEILFLETTTSGVRLNKIERKKLKREIKTVKTKYGDIRVKINRTDSQYITISPEYEDCKKIAASLEIPLKEIYDEAKASGRAFFMKSG